MKRIKKWLSFALGCILMLSIVGCGKQETPLEYVPTYNGTHINEVTDTDIPFIENGKTEYSLVVPQELTDVMKTAKEDFVLLFKRATGITISVVLDTGLEHNENNKYLSLGDNQLFRSTGLTVDAKELGYDGYQIFTKDKSIYMVGAYDTGSAYSIYSFFEHYFHYETYYADCVVIDTGVKNLTLKNLTVKEIPDIELRSSGMVQEVLYYRSGSEDCKYYANRLKSTAYVSTWMMPFYYDYDTSSKKVFTHNTATILPKGTYGSQYYQWFSNNGNQLCFSARGDAELFELMAQEVAKKVIFSYIHYSGERANAINISMEDNYETCSCEECQAISEYYGAESAAPCIFVNRVADIFAEWENKTVTQKALTDIFDEKIIGDDAVWMDVDPTPYIREDFRILFMAYNNYATAPVIYNEKKDTYTTKDDKVRLRDNVGIYWIDIEMNSQYGVLHESNIESRRSLEGWASMTDTIWCWNYATYINEQFCFYDSFNAINSSEYAFRALNNVKMQKQQISGGTDGRGGRNATFRNLLVYLHYKLAWNTSLNTQELVDNFFQAMYAEAGDIMQGLFNDMRVYCANMVEENDLHKKSSIYNPVDDAKYWNKQALVSWMNACDEALKKIEKYKTIDLEYYELIRGRIKTEYVSPSFLYLKYYGNEISSTEKYELVSSLKEDAIKYDLGEMADAEWSTIKWIEFLNSL